MGVKNRRPDLNGVLVIDKPLGWSSAKACAVARRLTGGAKVGHAGTLDPLATGVLVLCLGRATKSIATIQAMGKAYRAGVDLSRFTTTDDAEGENIPIGGLDPSVFGVTPAHAPLHHPEPRDTPTRSEIEQTLAERFTGHIDQRPPDFSAVKVGGRRAYKLARGGEVPTIQHKRVRIDAIDVLRYDWPELELDIRCGKGTYIRSLARDLGLTLGVGGTLTSLVRTAVGRYTLEGAIDPEKTTGAQLEQSLTEPPAPEQQPLSSADDEPGQMNDDTSAPGSTS